MASYHTFRPRNTAERAECGLFVRRLLVRTDLPKAIAPRIKEEVVPAVDAFEAARSANTVTGSRATVAGRAFRASSKALREAIERWMRTIDEANDDTGYAEAHLKGHFGDRSLSRLFQIGMHPRLVVLTDMVKAVREDPPLHGDAARREAVHTSLTAFGAATNVYDAALEARKVTVDALKAASAAFDVDYENLADRLLKNDLLDRLVPQFPRTRGGAKVPDPELELDPEADAPDEPEASAEPVESPDPTE